MTDMLIAESVTPEGLRLRAKWIREQQGKQGESCALHLELAATALQDMKAEVENSHGIIDTLNKGLYRASMELLDATERLSSLRNEVIEECAKVAESYAFVRDLPAEKLTKEGQELLAVINRIAENIRRRSLSHAQPIEIVK